ncbi:MAG: metallophosphoesterase [Clostridiales bacterium]|nr:metallophosphoesterase [Clostridiales bacterium]
MGDPQIGSSYENVATGKTSEQGQDAAVRNDSFNWNDTLEKAYELNPNMSFFLSAGDQIQSRDKKTSDTTHATYTANEIEYTGYLMPELLKSIPVATTIGNHDALSSNYSYHFNNPNASSTGSTYAGGDYYFSYGNTLFIMINTNNTNVAEHSAFIEEACKSDKDAEWRIVSLHQDIYGSGEHSNEPEIIELRYGLIPAFEDNDIDVVLTGHDHTYCRSYMMKGGTMDEESFISEDDFDAYIDGDIEIDETYNNYLTSIEDADYVAETDSIVVTNPIGILYMTANSASGSKYYDLVEHKQAYVAARWQEDIPTFSMINITDDTFTINTYRTDTMELIDTAFSIVKNGESAETTTGEVTEESTEETTETVTETTTAAETTAAKSKSSSSSSGGGSSYYSGKAAAKTTAETEDSNTDETDSSSKSSESSSQNTSTGETVKISIGNTTVSIGDKTYEIDAAPYIQADSNSTLVPLRFAALAILQEDIDEADTSDIISWDASTKTASVTYDGNTITFTSGSEYMYVNGEQILMSNGAKAEITNGRIYIPFRALGTALGIKVDWDSTTKTAIYTAE